MPKKTRKAVKGWLPQKGKRIEVRHSGRRLGISERAGFLLVLTLAIVIVLVGAILFG
jgi:hypothetical protein